MAEDFKFDNSLEKIKSILQCENCEYNTTITRLLKYHAKTHANIKYRCDKCDYTASRMNTLNRHIQHMHEGVVEKCPECDFVGKSKKVLRHHKQKIHEGRQYLCE